MLPFAVRSVTPRPNELVVRIPKDYLPDIIREVMPKWFAEDGELDGIPGLRARFCRGVIILRRPGLAGRISIPSTADRWRKALMIAASMCGQDPTLRLPWMTRHDNWDATELRHVESWPGRYSTDGWQYRNTRFASQILGRLPGLCPGPRPYFYSLWFNRFGDTCGVQFEWALGAAHKDVLSRLLDPVFGPGAEIALLEGQILDDCFTDSTYRVNVRCMRQPECWISLRRMTWDRRETGGNLGSFGEERRFLRAAVEAKYGY